MAKKAPLDTTIEVVTPENIAFEYQLAGPFRRLPAFLIDLFLRVAFFFLLLFAIVIIGGFFTVILAAVLCPLCLFSSCCFPSSSFRGFTAFFLKRISMVERQESGPAVYG